MGPPKQRPTEPLQVNSCENAITVTVVIVTVGRYEKQRHRVADAVVVLAVVVVVSWKQVRAAVLERGGFH